MDHGSKFQKIFEMQIQRTNFLKTSIKIKVISKLLARRRPKHQNTSQTLSQDF